MKFSVIIPSFNQGRWIRDCLSSINIQRQSLEVIIMDGGSTDSTAEVVAEFPQLITTFESKPDNGQAHAFNKGIHAAKGDIICWLNSDDLLCKSALSEVSSAFLKQDADVVYGRWFWSNPNLEKLNIDLAPRKVTANDFRAGHCLINQPAIFAKREVWNNIGPLREDLHFALDYEWLLRLLKSDFKLVQIDSPLSINRVHGEMKSKDSRLRREKLDVAKNVFGNEFVNEGSLMRLLGKEALRRYPVWFLLGHLAKRCFSISTSLPGVPVPKCFVTQWIPPV